MDQITTSKNFCLPEVQIKEIPGNAWQACALRAKVQLAYCSGSAVAIPLQDQLQAHDFSRGSLTGFKKGGGSEIQALRFDKSKYSIGK